jgi:serine/threonine-protein kinase
MGVVYRAVDILLNRPVALKVIHARLADASGARERVLREARLVASLNHPNVCTIYEVFSLDRDTPIAPAGAPVVALELIEGETLREHLARTGPLGKASSTLPSRLPRGLPRRTARTSFIGI